MRILDLEQRSPEWVAARLGKLTGSRAADMMATIKSGEAAARRNLRTQLVLERLTGKSQENGYQSDAMLRGTELEAQALAAYEATTGHLVDIVGFIEHDDLMTGVSPDGTVGLEGLVEIKCRNAARHLDALRGKIYRDAEVQCWHGLWLTFALWCDHVSYHPDFPDELRLKVTRIHRADVDLAAYEMCVRMFLNEVDREVASVQALVTRSLSAGVSPGSPLVTGAGQTGHTRTVSGHATGHRG